MLLPIYLTWALLAPAPVFQAAPSSHEPGERTATAAPIAGLDPLLEQALRATLAVEFDLVDLARPVDARGNPIENEAEYNAKLYGEGSALLAYLDPIAWSFDFRGAQVPSIEFVVEGALFDAGYQAALEFLATDEQFTPAQLLALFTPTFVAGPALLQTEEARDFARREQELGRLAPLGNGKALGSLTWGLLRCEAFWAQAGRDRETFLLELLSRGFDGRLVAATVRRALEPPLVLPREPLAAKKTGRPIAGPLAELRGKVGFTAAHEALLMGDLELVRELVALASDDPELDVRERVLQLSGERVVGALQTQRGFLKDWLPRMLALVREELYGSRAPEMMRRGRTLEERLTYWRQLFERYGFVTARDAALVEIEALLADADRHPNTERIEALLARKQAGALTPLEQAELERLERERERDHDALVRELVRLIAMTGSQDHYEAVLETLGAQLPALFASLPEPRQRDLLYSGWLQVGLVPQPKIVDSLEESLFGQGKLPPFASEALLYSVARNDFPGGSALLDRVLAEGTVTEIAASIANSNWMKPAQLQTTTGSLLETFDKPDCPLTDRARITASLLSAFESRPDEAKAFIQKTLDEGRWANPESPSYWGLYVGVRNRNWIRKLFTSEELAALEAAGKLKKGLL